MLPFLVGFLRTLEERLLVVSRPLQAEGVVWGPPSFMEQGWLQAVALVVI